MVVEISKKKIIQLEMADVLAELSIVRDRIRQLEAKYDSDFESFKLKVETSDTENFEEYDDLITWEGFTASATYLQKRLDDLKHAEDIVITE